MTDAGEKDVGDYHSPRRWTRRAPDGHVLWILEVDESRSDYCMGNDMGIDSEVGEVYFQVKHVVECTKYEGQPLWGPDRIRIGTAITKYPLDNGLASLTPVILSHNDKWKIREGFIR